MRLFIFAFAILFGTPICFAQETKPPESNKEQLAGFDWLKKFEGNWATAYNGTMSSRIVGKRWIVNEISFQKGLSSVQTIGYDAKKKQFIGTWIDSTSSHLWQYAGSLDSSGKKLTLEAEGPDLTDPTKSRRYRDIYEFRSESEIAAVSQLFNDQGKCRHSIKAR
jgi:hypothetical protein